MKTNSKILIYSASDAGYEWLSGVILASADGFVIRRAASWEELRSFARESALVVYEEGEDEWRAPSWADVSTRLESLGAGRLLYLSVFDFSSQAREAGFTRRIHMQRKPCGALELLKRVEDLAL